MVIQSLHFIKEVLKFVLDAKTHIVNLVIQIQRNAPVVSLDIDYGKNLPLTLLQIKQIMFMFVKPVNGVVSIVKHRERYVIYAILIISMYICQVKFASLKREIAFI